MNETPNPTPIVAIGASAGGLEALEAFFSQMPADSGFTLVVIQHLAPPARQRAGADPRPEHADARRGSSGWRARRGESRLRHRARDDARDRERTLPGAVARWRASRADRCVLQGARRGPWHARHRDRPVGIRDGWHQRAPDDPRGRWAHPRAGARDRGVRWHAAECDRHRRRPSHPADPRDAGRAGRAREGGRGRADRAARNRRTSRCVTGRRDALGRRAHVPAGEVLRDPPARHGP
jgi:hypothetical protein